MSGALLIEGLLRLAGSPVVGVFRDDVLFLLPLASVFGWLGWPDRGLSVRLGSVPMVPPDWALAAIGRSASAAASMIILFIALPHVRSSWWRLSCAESGDVAVTGERPVRASCTIARSFPSLGSMASPRSVGNVRVEFSLSTVSARALLPAAAPNALRKP
ncbi:MAG: hypothetical protein JSS04_27055 [Proteobacteria bacterium]|nr:hypothetical protein [Pseudomonadota bacterium]